MARWPFQQAPEIPRPRAGITSVSILGFPACTADTLLTEPPPHPQDFPLETILSSGLVGSRAVVGKSADVLM